MMSEKAETILSPNASDIKDHLDFLFSDLNEYGKDGRFEINQLVSGESYPVTNIEGAVKDAIKGNKAVSVYVVPSAIDPEAPNFGRCGNEDFYASNVVWCDIDEPHDPEDLKTLYAHCRPNRAVITATYPHRRIQLWWKLAEPLSDSATLLDALTGVMQNLGGDPKVTKVCQPMRLAGTVNYPSSDKLAKGRIVEQTKYVTIHDNPVDIDRFLESYPVKDYKQLADIINTNTGIEYTSSGSGLHVEETVTDGRETYAYRMVFASIVNYTRENGCFPTAQEVFDDVWPVYSKKVSSRSGDLEKDGRGKKMIAQKIKSKLRIFQNGGMARYGLGSLEDIVTSRPIPKEDEKTGNHSQEPTKDFKITDWNFKERYQGEAKEMEWLIDGVLPIGVPMMLAAVGGIGKSYKTLEMALRLCASVMGITETRVLGGPIVSYGNVAVFSAEDSYDSIHRRLNAIDPSFTRNNAKYSAFVVPMSEVGGTKPILKTTNDGFVVTDFYYDMKKQLSEIPDLKFIVIDPLQAFVEGDISSSNEFAQAVFNRCLIPMANELKATILVVHHMNKDGGFDIRTAQDARKAIRGVTGLVDGGRGTYCLWTPPKDIADQLTSVMGEGYEPERFAQGAMVKFNDQHNSDITTYYREENGLLRDIGSLSLEGANSGMNTEQCRQALREIRMAWEAGEPFRTQPRATKDATTWLIRSFGITRLQAKNQLGLWLNPSIGGTPILSEKLYKDEQRKERLGLYVNIIP